MNTLFQKLQRRFWDQARSRAVRPSRNRALLKLEVLEDRTVPSTITWTNRGQSSDNFTAVFGNNASIARGVVDTAINSWTSLVTNFNQPGGGNNIDVNISMQPGGYGGVTHITSQDNGWPTAATIALGYGNDSGSGYFLDPTPADSSEFEGTIVNAFEGMAQSGSPAEGKQDLYWVVTHELCHALGFAAHTRLQDYATNTGVENTPGKPALGYLWVFQGPSITHLTTSDNLGEFDAGGPEHSAYTNQAVNWNGQTLQGAEDLMNAGAGLSERRFIPHYIALMLHDAYNYTVAAAESFPTFYTLLNQTIGDLLIRGSGGSAGDKVQLDTFSFLGLNGLSVHVNVGNPVPGTDPNPVYTQAYVAESIHSITVDLGSGPNTITVLGTPQAAPMTINSTGIGDHVLFGQGNTQRIAGDVYITNPFVNIDLDDSGDIRGHEATVTDSSVSGLMQGSVYYPNGYINLDLTGGQGGSSYSVHSTPDANIVGGSTLTVDDQGFDSVHIGNFGSLAEIRGKIDVTGLLFDTTLYVDDSWEVKTDNTVTITKSAITGMTPASSEITYDGTLTALNITDSQGSNSYDVNSLPLFATTSLTTIGRDTVNVGKGDMSDWVGDLVLEANSYSGTTVNVDDSADRESRNVTITDSTINGFFFGTIEYLEQICVLNIEGSQRAGGTYSILSTAVNTRTDLVNESSGTVVVGSSGSCEGIRGTLNIENPVFLNALIVDDSADSATPTISLLSIAASSADSEGTDEPWGQISGIAADINFEYFDTSSLTLKTGTGDGTVVNVLATNPYFGPTNIVSNALTTVNVGDTGGVQNIDTTLNLENPVSYDTIFVDNGGDAFSRTVSLHTLAGNPADSEGITQHNTWGQISGLAPADINYEYADTRALTVETGSGADTRVNIRATGTTTTLLGTAATTTITVGAAGSVRHIRGTLNLETLSDQKNNITVDDSADRRNRTVILRSVASRSVDFEGDGDPWGQICHLAPADINYEYADTSSLTVDGGTGNNAYDVRATGPSTHTVLNTGPGQDNVNVGKEDTVDDIVAPLMVNAVGSGNATLNINDQSSTASHVYSVNAGVIYCRAFSNAEIDYRGVTQIVLNGSSTGSTYRVNSTSFDEFYTINGGRGNDTFTFSPANHDLGNLQGPVVVSGGGGIDSLTLNDQKGSATTYAMNGTEIVPGRAALAFDAVQYFGMATVVLNSSTAGGSTININGTAAGTSSTVNVGGGTDVVNVTPVNVNFSFLGGQLNAIAGPLTLTGTGSNTLTVSDQNSTAVATYFISTGTIQGSYRSAPRIIYAGMAVTLNGDNTADTFQLNSLPGTPFTVHGGTGTNSLDYSGYTGDVIVDLPLGYGTGLSALTSIRHVTGSNGNNLLVGDVSVNSFVGGTGRNILIGGGGINLLSAALATSDNILIGGTTAFDTNLAALIAMFAEWTRTDLSFADRVSDLSTGKNSVGATPLNKVGGQLILLTDSTVHANNTGDTLSGSKKTDPATGKRVHNWFFFDDADSLANFLSSSDRKTKIT